MSRVFVARDESLGRDVVIKVLSPELAQGLSAERFMREIRVAASLQQANIVPVLFAGSMGDLPYYAMPYVEGESLRHRLAAGALPVGEVMSVLRDVARALAYAHSRGLVHRDIKPDNVLISGGAAVVTDFGIAKAISAARTTVASATLTQLGTSIGTPAYMAPEQAAGDPNVDHRADLYSLGCMAFELLAGRPPFDDRTPQRTLAAHMTEHPRRVDELRPDCPPALAMLVMHLLVKEPDQRPQTASEVLSALDSVPTSGSATSMRSTLIGGHRRLWPLLAGYVLAFGAVVLLAKAAIVVIGLPGWVVPGAIVVMALGLPAILLTAYVQRVARHVATATPTLTPGGTMSPRMPQGTMATMAVKVSPHVSWRRTIRGGYVALGSFIVVVAVFMLMRTLGIGPARTLFAAGTLKSDDKLLVSGFSFSPVADSALAPILTEGLANALGQSRAVRLLSASDVATVMGQMKRTGAMASDDSLAREVAERAGASAIVSGRIVHTGNVYAVSLALRRAGGGDVLASFQKIAEGPRELLEVVDALTRELRGKMGESLRSVNRSVPLYQATTSSLEALRKYSEGARANDVDGDFASAVRLLREAVAIDSTFALAWRKLGIALGYGGYASAAMDSAYEHAARYADRLPNRERGLALGAYYSLTDRNKSLAAYESAYAADSNSGAAASQLMLAFVARRDYTRALLYARRDVALGKGPTNAALLAALLIRMGDGRTAAALLDSVVRSGGAVRDNVFFLMALATSLLQRNQMDSVPLMAEAMSRSPSARVRLEGLAILTRYSELRGQLASAARWRAAFSSLLASQDSTQLLTVSLLASAIDIVCLDRKDAARRRLEAVVSSPLLAHQARDRRASMLMEVAGLLARVGDPARAKALLTTVRSLSSSYIHGNWGEAWHRANGEVALAEGHTAEAVTEFRKSDADEGGVPFLCSECTALRLGRAFDAAALPDSAIANYERYLATPPYALSNTLTREYSYRAGVFKRLGELYDAKGDRAGAVPNYTTFVELWKNADPELKPAVDAVRKRLKEIAAREGK